MSGNYFAVDTDALAKASPEIRRLAQRINRLNSKLESGVNSLGECWGNDRNGQQFAKQYVKPKTQLLIGLDKASKVLDSMADGVETMSKGFTKTEEQAMDAASDIKKDLGDVKFPK
jgi:uncharacterized protein YukE